MARRPPLRHFTILLLKPEIETFSDALKADQDLVELDVPSVSGTLVAKPRQVKSHGGSPSSVPTSAAKSA